MANRTQCYSEFKTNTDLSNVDHFYIFATLKLVYYD